MQFHIENTNVGRVYEFNFLGLTINENLNWKNHIDFKRLGHYKQVKTLSAS